MALLRKPGMRSQDDADDRSIPKEPRPTLVQDTRGMPPNTLPGEDPGLMEGERVGTSPRENADLGGGVNLRSAPSRPMSPTPMAGSVSMPSPGPMPFKPMGAPSPASLTRPRSGNLYGSMGGLQGGGLGLPFDPTSNQKSDPISTLLQILTRR